MKFIILLLLIPMSYAKPFNKQVCEGLSDMVQHFEGKLYLQNLLPQDENGEADKSEICSAENVLEQVTETHPDFTSGQKEKVNKYACHTLAAIDERIANLENEQSLLMGFKKLKADLSANKKEVSNPNLKAATFAGLNFVDGLNAAKNMELLLGTAEGNLLRAMKGKEPSERSTVAQVKKFIRDACKADKSATEGLCKKGAFNPNQTALDAINALITKSDLNAKTLTDWQQALAIQKTDGEAYSFTEMSQELKGNIKNIEDGVLSLNRQQLNAIKALPDFTDREGPGLTGMKKDIKVFEIMQEYKFHVQDLKGRQQFEVQSKVVLLWNDLKNLDGLKLSPEDRDICSGTKLGYDKAMHCLGAIKNSSDNLQDGSKKSLINEFVNSINVTNNYLNELEVKNAECLEITITEEIKVSGELPKSCIEAFKKIDEREPEISSELFVLNAIKDKIAHQNEETMEIRNLSLSKLKQANCLDPIQSNLECSYENGQISKTAEVLTSHMVDLMVVRSDSPEVDASKFCNDKEKKFYKKDILCAVPKKSKPKKKEPTVNPDEFQAPVEAPDGGHSSPTRDAAINGLGLITGTVLGSIFTPQQNNFNYYPPYNPYQYNYGPYNSGYPVMGLADQILFNARYHGAYGLYMPTQGLQPYTAFGSSPSPFTSSRSAFFSGP